MKRIVIIALFMLYICNLSASKTREHYTYLAMGAAYPINSGFILTSYGMLDAFRLKNKNTGDFIYFGFYSYNNGITEGTEVDIQYEWWELVNTTHSTFCGHIGYGKFFNKFGTAIYAGWGTKEKYEQYKSTATGWDFWQKTESKDIINLGFEAIYRYKSIIFFCIGTSLQTPIYFGLGFGF